jgi:hypothetical protein
MRRRGPPDGGADAPGSGHCGIAAPERTGRLEQRHATRAEQAAKEGAAGRGEEGLEESTSHYRGRAERTRKRGGWGCSGLRSS